MSEEVQFEEVLRSLRRSRVRTEIVMYLYKIYPNASYPAEISRNTGIDPTNILGGLRGMGNRFDAGNSLLKQGVVEKMERGLELCVTSLCSASPSAWQYNQRVCGSHFRSSPKLLSEPSPFHRIMSGYLQTSPIHTSAYEDTHASA